MAKSALTDPLLNIISYLEGGWKTCFCKPSWSSLPRTLLCTMPLNQMSNSASFVFALSNETIYLSFN